MSTRSSRAPLIALGAVIALGCSSPNGTASSAPEGACCDGGSCPEHAACTEPSGGVTTATSSSGAGGAPSTTSGGGVGIVKALKKYGLVLTDIGGAYSLRGEHSSAWNAADVGKIGAITMADFEVPALGAMHTSTLTCNPASKCY